MVNGDLEDMVNDKEVKKFLKYAKKNNINPKDMVNLAKAVKQGDPTKKKTYRVGKSHVKIGIISDTHMGNVEYDRDLMKHAVKEFDYNKVDFVVHGGDVVDGWYQNRPTQLFESDAIGFDRQLSLAVNQLGQISQPLYFITANHEYNTYMRGAGVELGHVLESKLREGGRDAHFLGNQEGDIKLKSGTSIKIFHPDGGTAYALSYRPQKIVESFESGKKPKFLIVGHFHKFEYLFYRNVHVLQAATLCGQTKFMRGKNIPAHRGFTIVDLYTRKGGQIDKAKIQFYPAYD